MPEELSPSQAARLIGTTTRSVQRWIKLGRLPARRVGGRWRVASDALDAFVVSGEVADGEPRDAATGTGGGRRSAGDRGGATGTPAREPATGLDRAVRSPIRTLFIANRGEIARRIARTADRLGLRAVLPSTEGDGLLDLLDRDAVVAAALVAGADAVHPGYGFLAEQPAFAEAVLAAGLRWVGPPPAAMRAMGDKAAARRLAASLGVPVLSGYDGDLQSDEALSSAATAVGFPLLVKPTGGGGGKGMRVVSRREDLAAAIAAARREASAAFADARLILERYLVGPRHVEVQVLFDEHGNGIHLGERDCSIQRRHQKVLEETPSPAVDAATRTRLGRAALTLASAVGYASAGTVEFLLEEDGSAWFLEMNTRLQVEHPVTEAVTGRDLVADQLRIAEGATLASLGLDQATIDAARSAGGHAVEVRLYAEDAEAGFLPATGSVLALRWPAGPGIRVDTGIETGIRVDDRFDPMLAKIVAHGRDRAEALQRLATALDETMLLGLVTNLRFLRWLVRDEAVLEGDARVDTLESRWPPEPLAAAAGSRIPDEAWGDAARILDRELRRTTRDPWTGGWRLNGPARLRLAADDGTRTVAVLQDDERRQPAGRAWAVSEGALHLDVDGRSVAFRVAPPPDVDRAARSARPVGGAGPSTIAAPMPGSVVAVHVVPGTAVAPGDPVVTLGAMKMEHVVAAPGAGLVTEVLVRPGEQVARDQPLAIVGG